MGVGPHPGSNFVADCPSGVLHTFAPILFNFSQSTLDLLEVMNPDVRCYILDHPLASTTFNFRPRTITFSHKDLKNLSWRLCTVINLSSYDPMKGRHFVLWDLGITVEFFPYSTPLPSAVILHNNTPIGNDKTRMIITQYSSVGLFAWREYGYMPKGVSTQATAWWNYLNHMFSRV